MNRAIKAKSNLMTDIIDGDVTAVIMSIDNAYLHNGEVCRRTLRDYESVGVDRATLAAVTSGFLSVGDNVKVMETYKMTKEGDFYFAREDVPSGSFGIVSPIACPFSKALTVVTINEVKAITFDELTKEETKALGFKRFSMERLVDYLADAPGRNRRIKESVNEIENDLTSGQFLLYVSFEVLIEDYRKEKPRFAQTLIS